MSWRREILNCASSQGNSLDSAFIIRMTSGILLYSLKIRKRIKKKKKMTLYFVVLLTHGVFAQLIRWSGQWVFQFSVSVFTLSNHSGFHWSIGKLIAKRFRTWLNGQLSGKATSYYCLTTNAHAVLLETNWEQFILAI